MFGRALICLFVSYALSIKPSLPVFPRHLPPLHSRAESTGEEQTVAEQRVWCGLRVHYSGLCRSRPCAGNVLLRLHHAFRPGACVRARAACGVRLCECRWATARVLVRLCLFVVVCLGVHFVGTGSSTLPFVLFVLFALAGVVSYFSCCRLESLLTAFDSRNLSPIAAHVAPQVNLSWNNYIGCTDRNGHASAWAKVSRFVILIFPALDVMSGMASPKNFLRIPMVAIPFR